jgi:phage terminase Nu1 subunit (DNA packaging protein)
MVLDGRIFVETKKDKKMVQIKQAKQTKTTTQMTFCSNNVDELSNNIALALLTGSFNTLRKYSKNGQPINLDKLKNFKEKFDDLIYDVKSEMSINIKDVVDF